MDEMMMESATAAYWKVNRVLPKFGVKLDVFQCMQRAIGMSSLEALAKFYTNGLLFFYLHRFYPEETINLSQHSNTNQNLANSSLSFVINPFVYLMQQTFMPWKLTQDKVKDKITEETISFDEPASLSYRAYLQTNSTLEKYQNQFLRQQEIHHLQNFLKNQQNKYSTNEKTIINEIVKNQMGTSFYPSKIYTLNNTTKSHASHAIFNTNMMRYFSLPFNLSSRDWLSKINEIKTFVLEKNREDQTVFSHVAHHNSSLNYAQHYEDLTQTIMPKQDYFSQTSLDHFSTLELNSNQTQQFSTESTVNHFATSHFIYRKNHHAREEKKSSTSPMHTLSMPPNNISTHLVTTQSTFAQVPQSVQTTMTKNNTSWLSDISSYDLTGLATMVQRLIEQKLKKDAERRGLR